MFTQLVVSLGKLIFFFSFSNSMLLFAVFQNENVIQISYMLLMTETYISLYALLDITNSKPKVR